MDENGVKSSEAEVSASLNSGSHSGCSEDRNGGREESEQERFSELCVWKMGRLGKEEEVDTGGRADNTEELRGESGCDEGGVLKGEESPDDEADVDADVEEGGLPGTEESLAIV